MSVLWSVLWSNTSKQTLRPLPLLSLPTHLVKVQSLSGHIQHAFLHFQLLPFISCFQLLSIFKKNSASLVLFHLGKFYLEDCFSSTLSLYRLGSGDPILGLQGQVHVLILSNQSNGCIILATVIGSVQFSCSVVSDSLQLHESQHTRPSSPSPTPGVHSNSRPSSR